MDIWIVENGELERYKRFGECNGCTACCRDKRITYQLSVTTRSSNDDGDQTQVIDWSNHEGWAAIKKMGLWWWIKTTKVEDRDTGDACATLDKNGKCKKWQDVDEWPALCRWWPVHPDDLAQFPQCGFEFERVVE